MQLGKLEVIKREMRRLDLAIVGLSETKWTGQGHFNSDEYKVIMSGPSEGRRNGVAVICNGRVPMRSWDTTK